MTTMKLGDNVLISPDLTGFSEWIEGNVIEVENNPFNGIVIAAETADTNVFFGRQDLFKLQKSPLEDIPCITADITTQEIVELLRESRAGVN